MEFRFWKRIIINDKKSCLERIVLGISEFCGTAILMIIGCMGCVNIPPEPPRSVLLIAFAFGLAVMIAIECVGHVSGCHINPMVSIAAVILGDLAFVELPIYLLAQVAGAHFGFWILTVLTPFDYHQYKLCSPSLNEHLSETYGFGVEFTISFFLVFACCGVWDARNAFKLDSIPIRFGLTVTALAAVAIPYTGAHMNPARTLAPAVINNRWDHIWIYFAGPFLAAIVTPIFYNVFLSESQSEAPLEESDRVLSASRIGFGYREPPP